MSMMYRSAFVLGASLVLVGVASAQPAPDQPQQPQQPQPPTTMPATPAMPAPPSTATTLEAQPAPAKEGDDKKPKEPKRGDFDAGGEVRLPNGPDEMGQYATFNWVTLDAKARYYLLDSVFVSGSMPLAVKHPDMIAGGIEPKMIGGWSARLEAKLPKMPKLPGIKYETEVGLMATVAYMHEGAMLLSEKDFPLFTGDFQPGFCGGLIMKVKLSSVVDFSLTPSWVYQSGTAESLTAVQIPMSLIVQLGTLVKTSVDLGVFTGDNYSFGGEGGGRISTGGSLTVKLGPILAHAGAGVASLLTGGLYPTIRDSVYIDLNVKYAK